MKSLGPAFCLPPYIDFILKRDPLLAEELLHLQLSHSLNRLSREQYPSQ